jgi:secreted trypsin-like serine protease
LRQTDVPLVNAEKCQEQLRTTSLGPEYVLDAESFICAGGEVGNDTCSRDSGSSLFCEVAGQLYIAGLVAWNLGTNKFKVTLI